MPDWKNYIVDLQGLDCENLLSYWRWLLGERRMKPIALTFFGDWILESEDGKIHLINTVDGDLRTIAASQWEFERQAGTPELQNEWFMSEMVDLLRERGMMLKKDECYGYKIAPILGGGFDSQNIQPFLINVHQCIHGQLHEQTKSLPPGTRINGFQVDGESP